MKAPRPKSGVDVTNRPESRREEFSRGFFGNLLRGGAEGFVVEQVN